MRRSVLACGLVAALALALMALVPSVSEAAGADFTCAAPTPGHVGCFAVGHEVTASAPGSGARSGGVRSDTAPAAVPANAGFSAAALQGIYGATSAPGAGSGPVVAVIDAFHYPQVESDLTTYRAESGLPACTTANSCFRQVDENGVTISSTAPSTEDVADKDDWSGETALDLDMVSAICPSCRILLVSASNEGSAIDTGITRAVSLGAQYVSMSFGGDPTTDSSKFFNADTGVVFTAASGDDGYTGPSGCVGTSVCAGPSWPSEAEGVVSVGGVSDRSGSLAVWNDSEGASGSGCAIADRNGHTPAQPAAQAAVAALTATCRSAKAENDLAAIADPETGVAIYLSGGWYEFGGTSAASPILAALYADAGNHTQPFAAYANAGTGSLITDVTAGSNCLGRTATICTAGVGWDGPTGLGMPTSPEALALPMAAPTMSASALTATVGQALDTTLTLPATAPDTGGTPWPLGSVTATVSGLPAGVTATVGPTSIALSGTPTTAGSGKATITLTGTTTGGRTTPTGTAMLAWSVSDSTGGGQGPTDDTTAALLAPTLPAVPGLSGRAGHALSLTLALPTTTRDADGSVQTLSSLAASVTGLPAGLTTQVTGSRLTISGTPSRPGSGTAHLVVTGTTGDGRTTPQATASLSWTVAPQSFQAHARPRIKGAAKRRHTVRVTLPTLRADTGAAVRPTWTVVWLLGDKVVHRGTTYRLPAKATGKRLTARVTATEAGFTTATWTSAPVRVRR
jgi:hypothetical protein